MKICWDTLDGFYLGKSGNFRKKSGSSWVEMDGCEWCGESYLTQNSSPSKFCCIEHSRRINLTGQEFGRWKVKENIGMDEWGNLLWKCECSCGSIIIVNGNNLRNGTSKSCGCINKEILSKLMRGVPKSEEQRKKMSENSGNYNPNLTDEDRIKRRHISGYEEWRVLVYELDKYICQNCGVKGNYLNAHHIESYNSNPELRTEVSNGITLCKNCHKDFHHLFGQGNNTRAQLIKFLKGGKSGGSKYIQFSIII